MSGKEKISLKKAEKITLKKSIEEIEVGLGWINKPGFDVDLDLAVAFMDKDGNIPSPVMQNLLFYLSPKVDGKHTLYNGATVHLGDSRSGGGAEDEPNEVVKIKLAQLPDSIVKAQMLVSIYDDESEGIDLTFAGVKSSFASLSIDGKIRGTYKVEETPSSTFMVIAEITKDANGVWSFKAIGEDSTLTLGSYLEANANVEIG